MSDQPKPKTELTEAEVDNAIAKLLQIKADIQESIGLQVDKLIKIDEITENSVLVLKIGDPEMLPRMMLALEDISVRYGEALKHKNVSVVVLDGQTTLEVANEQQMEKIGWKKQGNRIITPDKFLK